MSRISEEEFYRERDNLLSKARNYEAKAWNFIDPVNREMTLRKAEFYRELARQI